MSMFISEFYLDKCITFGHRGITSVSTNYNGYALSPAPLSIIMFKDGERIDFDAKITSYSLERFVEDIVA